MFYDLYAVNIFCCGISINWTFLRFGSNVDKLGDTISSFDAEHMARIVRNADLTTNF